MSRSAALITALIVLSGCARYELAASSSRVWRLDRWTGEVCVLDSAPSNERKSVPGNWRGLPTGKEAPNVVVLACGGVED